MKYFKFQNQWINFNELLIIMAQVSDCFLKGIVCDYYQYKVIIFTSKSTTTSVKYTFVLCYITWVFAYWAIFSCFYCRLLTFFKISLSYQEHNFYMLFYSLHPLILYATCLTSEKVCFRPFVPPTETIIIITFWLCRCRSIFHISGPLSR